MAIAEAARISLRRSISALSLCWKCTDISESSKAIATRVADLLGIDLETLRGALVTRLIMNQRPPRTQTEACNARDALARTIYKYLFNVLVDIVNKALSGDAANSSDLFLGMLDIFGSEVLAVNSFEQVRRYILVWVLPLPDSHPACY